jgi:argininosuccinate lyase
MQEDKPPLFDSVDTVKASLEVLTEMFPGIRYNGERMLEAASGGYSTATDLAEYLVRAGLPFRKAHEATGKLVLYATVKGKTLEELTLKEFRRFSPIFKEDLYSCLSPEASVMAKSSEGGTSPSEVKRQLRRLKALIRSPHKRAVRRTGVPSG